MYFIILLFLLVSYEYVGCFFDDSKRLLEEGHSNNAAMSADICFGICTGSQTWIDDDYFGTEVTCTYMFYMLI